MGNHLFRIQKWKTQVSLFLPLAFLVLLMFIIGFGQFKNPFLSQLKMALIETVTPIVRVVSAPVRFGKNLFWGSKEFINTYNENKQLKAEIEDLKNWKNIALQLRFEQEQYQKLLNYVPPPKASFVTAKTLTDNGSRFSRSIIVSAGDADGVSKGDVAMTSSGIVGRVVAVGHHISRLMLLTDYASRVPIVVGDKAIKGVLTGDGSDTPKIIALPENQTVRVGDIVFSSGQVGVYPSGLGIGVVEAVSDGEISVRLFETDQTPMVVRLVNFGLNDVLLSDKVME
ncbi:MAG: rod shape-determining protein MreC [Pseudomonadota bacterium]|nr:rod shape-determining protein MreC [Pseudomonadota bacterium]